MFGKKGPPPPRNNIGGEPLPFSVRSEPIVGYRLWKVKPDAQGAALWSVNAHYRWEVHNQARCIPPPPMVFGAKPLNQPLHPEPAPFKDCACGIYCSLPDQPITEWEHTVYGRVHASGSVLLTGRVIRCTMGFKAEHAEVMSPVVLNAHCSAGLACEGDVVRVDLQSDHARGWCENHSPRVGVDAGQYMRNTAAQLEARYPGVEFLSWWTFEGGY